MRMSILGELCTKYWQVLSSAWTARHHTDSPIRQAAELEFLPAALELQESPPYPAARIVLWSLLAFVLIAIAWTYFARVDMVAIAPGKRAVSDQSKVIQPLEAGVVKSISVRDGQIVRSGLIAHVSESVRER